VGPLERSVGRHRPARRRRERRLLASGVPGDVGGAGGAGIAGVQLDVVVGADQRVERRVGDARDQTDSHQRLLIATVMWVSAVDWSSDDTSRTNRNPMNGG